MKPIKFEDIGITPELLEAMKEQKQIEYDRANPPIPYKYEEETTEEELLRVVKQLIKEEVSKQSRSRRTPGVHTTDTRSSSTDYSTYIFPVVE